MIRSPALRLLASLGVVATVVIGPSAPVSAESTARARVAPNTCSGGLGTAHIKLYAADGAESTFKTRLQSFSTGAILEEEDTVAAGQQQSVAFPDLFYGDYDLQVFAEGERILRESLAVGCLPESPYQRPTWDGFSNACTRSTTFTVRNRPIKGAEELLRTVHFRVFLEGGPTYLETDLPDTEGDPYSAAVTVPWGPDPGVGSSADPQVLATANGEPLDASGWSTTGCVPDPEPPLPNTGG